ncbi:hypothetical protein [Bradyrhizobium sp. LA2.1]|uniref:hypothetical protein n=1 Tax=Bradyrhizobium sp. LA2.1 TaxID=3156376 RepID=UPI0033986FE5
MVDRSRPEIVPAQTEERGPEAVRMYGDFLDNVTVVKNSMMSLLLAVGSIEQASGKADDAPGKPVLVPFVEMKLEGEQDPYFAQVMTLDNVAYLICDLTSDFEVVSKQLLTVASGGMAPEIGRIEQAREYIKAARDLTEQSLKHLEAISSLHPQ